MALFLDLDNTLIPSKEAYTEAIQSLSKDWEEHQYGKKEQFIELYDLARSEIKGRLKEHSSNRLRLLCFQNLIESLYGYFNASNLELCLWLDERYFFHFLNALKKQIQEKQTFSSLFHTVGEISKSVPIVLLTNETLMTQLKKIKATFPKDLRYTLVCSESVGVEKPSPYFFTYAITKSKAKLADSVMIGDNLKDDILGAEAVGLRAIHIKSILGVPEGNSQSKVQNKEGLVYECESSLSALSQLLENLKTKGSLL
ncbi:putative dehalogenase-like hydrolase [Leptospira ryugenii]|uniref:Putative dehalogenase-like hydrolase n=2 Tax=Leptospira ryugenii TaxID=1917863 RepID=A0A2P2DZZ6_9LEPT|nr:putative dehalogenase-like hydrolase [Leptospira ryugenii]